ncbi:MAG: ROK family protein [Clostridiales bacterium]|nr:ROK family protein [Clostridiales bacterium]
MAYYLGYDIGGTKCAVSLAYVGDGTAEIKDKIRFPTAGMTPTEVMEKFALGSEEITGAHGVSMSEIERIGISCGGPLDSRRGIIQSPPNLPGWDDVRITEFFEKRFSVQTRLQNDANACAVAEWQWGAGLKPDGSRVSDMVFVTFGTGFGAGLILDGRLYSGATDSAGEVGHVRMTRSENDPVGYRKAGSVEGWCSGGGIAQQGVFAVRKELASGVEPDLWLRAGRDESGVTAKLIGDMADEGDELCLSIYRRVGEKFGEACAMMIDLFNPELIVAGGIFMRSSHLILPYAEQVIREEALTFAADVCRIVPAGLGEKIGDYAALGIAAM